MNDIYEYMSGRYSMTKWKFFSYNDLVGRFGDKSKDQLNNLWKKGLIKKREGCNYPLVELK